MLWQSNMTEGTISGAAIRVAGKSTTRYDLVAADKVLGQLKRG
jgi:hypothetical protein